MPDEIDMRVSPSLHPGTFKVLDGYDEDSAKFIGDAVSAFNDAYVTIGKIHNATEVGKRNAAWSDEMRILAVSKLAAKEQERLSRRFDAATTYTQKAFDHVERELSAPVASRASLAIAQEVRAHVKGLDTGERLSFIRRLIASGYDLSASAVLGGPAFLSGIDSDTQATFTRMYHERQNPTLATRQSLLRSVLDKLGRDAPLLFREVDKAVGAPPAKVRVIDAANEAALAALKIEPAA